jgi:hypothetical protein
VQFTHMGEDKCIQNFGTNLLESDSGPYRLRGF